MADFPWTGRDLTSQRGGWRNGVKLTMQPEESRFERDRELEQEAYDLAGSDSRFSEDSDVEAEW